jgi:D-aminopeptidase
MATTSKVLFRGAASTSSTTLYTVPTTSTTTIVTNILVTNTTVSDATFTLLIDDVSIATTILVGGLDTTVIDLKQVIPANATPKTIKGSASATTVNFHISGVEIV